MEKRAISAEIRAQKGDDKNTVRGLGIVYDQWTELYPGYMERIKKGAVKMAGATVKSFFNHDPDKVLSTLDSNPALELKETDAGLEYISPIPPTTYGQDLMINLERGNVKGSSFSFDVPRGGDRVFEDEAGVFYRDISELNLYEVGPVTNPAYIQTTALMRSAVESWKPETKPEKKVPLGLRQKQQKQSLID
jgi:uncharacterized protein